MTGISKMDLSGMEGLARAASRQRFYPFDQTSVLALIAEHKATKERLAEVTAETCDAHEMLDRYGAPRDDEGEGGGPLSLSGRIEAKVYADAVTAEAQLARAKEALEPFALEIHPDHTDGDPYRAYFQVRHIRFARTTLQALDGAK